MSHVKRLWGCGLALGLALGLATSAEATSIPLSAVLDGAQAGTGSPGTGTATVTYDDVSGLLSWDISWSGLQGSTTVAHFHGPAAPGQSASPVVDIFLTSTTSPASGSDTITPSEATDLLAGLWYINIHTTSSPGGEIRGQVVPEPSTFLLALGGTAGLLLLRRRHQGL
jgi:hypothetical protein